MVFFFFSSRRRHTRCGRDWSSDVCSSDLLLMPVCAWLLASGRWGVGLWLTAVVGSTDWVDGWLARRTGSVSRLGQLMDPFADRLLIASVTIALLVRGVLPLVAVALLVGRDLLLLAGFPLLASRGVRP